MRKRIIAFISLALLVFGLCACGSTGSSKGKDINVVFSKVGFGSSIADVKSVYGECPTEDVSVSDDGKFEYRYPCDYISDDASVFFGFNEDEELITIRLNYHGASEDVSKAYDKLYNDLVDGYGKPEQEQSGAMAMWNNPHIYVSKMSVFSNDILDCSFFSPEYTESIKNGGN